MCLHRQEAFCTLKLLQTLESRHFQHPVGYWDAGVQRLEATINSGATKT